MTRQQPNNNFMEYDPKFANWNKFYDDINQEITEIRRIGNRVLYDVDNTDLYICRYFTRIDNFFSTHGHYIVNTKSRNTIKKKLDILQIFLFEKFIPTVKENPRAVEKSKIKAYNNLKNIFSIMCANFSTIGLTVKIDAKNTEKLSDSINDEEEKQHTKNLEMAGLI
jgi:hypothetical protein